MSEPITLTTPIERQSGDKITELTLRKPTAGELRGLSLKDLLNAEVDAVMKLIPRIASPTIIPAEVDGLEPCDLAALSSAVIDFLLTPDQRTKAIQLMERMA